MKDLQKVKDFIKGKTVAIVGNAKSIFGTCAGADIDAHDVVFRFNKGFISDPSAQGVRTDILILACELSPEELLRFGAKYTINRSYKTKCGDYTFDNYFRKMFCEVTGYQPSSGFMAVRFCIEAQAAKIDLYGFDFGRSPTFYNAADYQTKHNYALEEKILQAQAICGAINIE